MDEERDLIEADSFAIRARTAIPTLFGERVSPEQHMDRRESAQHTLCFPVTIVWLPPAVWQVRRPVHLSPLSRRLAQLQPGAMEHHGAMEFRDLWFGDSSLSHSCIVACAGAVDSADSECARGHRLQDVAVQLRSYMKLYRIAAARNE